MLIYSVCNASFDADIREFTYLVMDWLFLDWLHFHWGKRAAFPQWCRWITICSAYKEANMLNEVDS